MKSLFGCIAVFILIFAFSVFGNAQNAGKSTISFNPSGDYHPENSPAIEAEKFIQFNLQVKQKKGKLIASGEIRGVQPWYKFTAVSVTEKSLKFSTAKVKGISYQFGGEFIGTGDFARQFAGNGVAMLKGTLRKFVNNKKSSELTTSFIYYPGC